MASVLAWLQWQLSQAHNLSEKGSMKNLFYKAGRVSFSAQSAELSCLKLGCKSTHVWPEGSYVIGTSNYNYSNTGPFSTGHLPRWFLGDALWISTTVSCQSHRDTTPGWNSFPQQLARWVMFPATLQYPLSWRGHLLCQICALTEQSGSLL